MAPCSHFFNDGIVQSGVGAVGGAVGGVVPGLGHADLSADALKAREAAVHAREDAVKVRFYPYSSSSQYVVYFLLPGT